LLVLCVRGKRVGEFVHEDFPAPVEAILADDELPLDAQGAVDQRSKRYGQHIRRCRRAVAELIAKLCADYPKLAGEAKASARALLLAYAGERMEQAAKGSITTDRGLDAVRVVPLILDVGGEAHSLADIEGMGRVDAVGPSAVAPESGLELPRPVLRVDAAAERCLAGMKVRRIDERWQRELEALRELAKVPRYVLPEVATIAWVERKATIAGGLQAHLWISREVGPQTLVFTRAGREVGRILLLNALPCSGVVEGDGLVIGEAVELEARQRGSLAKQICMLYEMLAKQLRAGRFSAEERERVLARLVEVDAALTEARESLLGSIGKPLEQLQAALVGIVSPAMRKVRAPVVPAVVKVPVKKIVERPVAVEKPAVVARAVVVEKPVVEAGATAMVPRQVLLAAVREELAWARERHGSLLETLGLAQLMIGEVPGGGIAAFSGGIVLQRRHPLVDRMLTGLLAGEAIDPIDLSFVVSAVYTLMNEVAEEIDAEDERAFVGRMAESLALGLR